MLLSIKDLHVSYGGIKAVRGLNIQIEDNKIITLIGANGAGKSSTLRAIVGMERKAQGEVFFQGEDISNLPTREIIKRGISMAPEGRHVFPDLTVRENLILGAYTIKERAKIEERIDFSYNLFPILGERSWQKAGTLSGGEQQMLAVARALMIEPKLLILDEPSLGLAPILVQEIFEIIQQIHALGNTILLVEQNANKALAIADYAYVLESGVVVLEGEGKKLLADPEVRAAYLGD